ncbi:MAG: VanZ family protein [Cryobacterium sp.]|nr:VanZ family protein [Cryobacterium sp.]
MDTVTRRRHAALRRVARWLAAGYVVALCLIAFWPTPVDRGAAGTISGLLARLHAHGVPDWVTYQLVEFTANIALFLPVGLLGVVLVGANQWWWAVVAGFTVSSLIELSQLMFLPGRFPTAADVVANTTGAVFGALLAVLLLDAVTSRERSARS